ERGEGAPERSEGADEGRRDLRRRFTQGRRALPCALGLVSEADGFISARRRLEAEDGLLTIGPSFAICQLFVCVGEVVLCVSPAQREVPLHPDAESGLVAGNCIGQNLAPIARWPT